MLARRFPVSCEMEGRVLASIPRCLVLACLFLFSAFAREPFPYAQETALTPGQEIRWAGSLRAHTAAWRLVRTVDDVASEVATMHAELSRVEGAWEYAVAVQFGAQEMSYRYRFAAETLEPMRSVYDDPSGFADVAFDHAGLRGSIEPPGSAAPEEIVLTKEGGFFEAGTIGFVLALAGLEVGDVVSMPSVDLHEREPGTIRATANERRRGELPDGRSTEFLVVSIEQLGGTRSVQWLMTEPPYWSNIFLGNGDARWELVEVDAAGG